MVTDDERREVARRLRELKDPYWAGGNSSEASMDVMGVESYLRRNGLSPNLADLIEPSCDRDALLEEVKELEKCAWYFGLDLDEDEPLRDRLEEASEAFAGSARRIREACGEGAE